MEWLGLPERCHLPPDARIQAILQHTGGTNRGPKAKVSPSRGSYESSRCLVGSGKQPSSHEAAHHDVADTSQLLQEIQILADGTIPLEPGSTPQAFPTHTSFKDVEDLEAHLADSSSCIKKMAESIINNLASARGQVPPNISNLESQVNRLLANQKDFLVKLDRLTSERDGFSEQLNTATLRYMKAERKLDRLKSNQVQKLEQAAFARATAPPTGSELENGTGANESNGNYEALQVSLQEATVVSQKRQEQLEIALAQAKTLQEELTAAQVKLTSLTDEDYSRTEVFKLSKTQHEELIKKINHLEVANKKALAEKIALADERNQYRKKLEDEAQTLTLQLEDELQQSDTNLARVRSARDELHAEVTQLRASKEQERASIAHFKELTSAQEARINALEVELQRLQPSEDVDMTARPDIDSLELDELREKYKRLQKDFDSINHELPPLTAAVKKYQALANKKLGDYAELEEKLATAIAERSKANQKYYDACKDTGPKKEEITRLRSQNNRSSEIISQLKENEAQSRTLLGNLEKQMMDLKQTNTAAMTENKRLESSSNEVLRRYDVLKSQVTELNSLAKSKDSATTLARERTVALEADNERLKVRLDNTSKDRDKWKVKSLNNSSEEEDMLRRLATCSVCHKEFKDTVIKTCGHTFCRGCVEDRIANRMRKCPNCNKAFDRVDLMGVHL
ncbi:RING-12 protein [Pseudomassariella vexata]|uniref:E3 ubiquitin protein ligase n=1 Tax=Pseudomassariella vexata TaxID=1141098 RepID=A0A1Y2EEV5_9PEZI|nr:RING-12 protein [Pseudomassariella vexata]ORY70089.1 RING-12 protein [Pseudomassariella vexata]